MGSASCARRSATATSSRRCARAATTSAASSRGTSCFLDHNTTGDGLLTALQVLAIMRRSGRPLSELVAGFERLPQVLVNVNVAEKRPLEELPEFQKQLRAVEAALGGRGRVLVRYSGTEPKARVMVEGDDEARVRELRAGARAALQRSARRERPDAQPRRSSSTRCRACATRWPRRTSTARGGDARGARRRGRGAARRERGLQARARGGSARHAARGAPARAAHAAARVARARGARRAARRACCSPPIAARAAPRRARSTSARRGRARARCCARCATRGIGVAALVAPTLDAVKGAHAQRRRAASSSTRARSSICRRVERRAALEQLGDAARLAAKLRLGLGARGRARLPHAARGDPGRARGGAGRGRPRRARRARCWSASTARCATCARCSHERAVRAARRGDMLSGSGRSSAPRRCARSTATRSRRWACPARC